MGYMRHHTIVVTGFKFTDDSGAGDHFSAAYNKANGLFPELVTEIIDSPWNHYQSFCVVPDGSKEGWDESNDYDRKRAEFLDLLRTCRFDDGSCSVDWVEVQFGDDEDETKITADSDEHRR